MSLTRRNTAITLFWSGLNTLQFFVKNIFFISLFLKYRSGQDYGFWIILMSFYGMTVYVCDGYVRYCLNEYTLKYYKDKVSAIKYFRDGFIFFLVVGLVILALLLALIYYLPLPASIFNTSTAVVHGYGLQYCLYIIIFISLLNCLVRYISGAIEPDGNIHITNRYIALYSLSETVLFFTCIFLSVSLQWIFISMLLFLSLINAIYVFSLFRKYSVYKGGLIGSVRGGAKLFIRSLLFITNNFFEKLTLDGINFMIAIFYPATLLLLPVYASNRTMANVLVSTSNVFIGVFTIEYQRLSIQKDAVKLLKMLHAIWLFLGLCINFGLVCIYPVLAGIYRLWTHGKLPVDPLFFYTVFSIVILNVYGSVIIIYLKSLNAIKRLLPVSLVRALLVFLMIILFPKQPLYLVLALLIAEFIVNVILLNILLYRELIRINGLNVASTLLWNVLPYMLTAIFLPASTFLPTGYWTNALAMIAVLLLVYTLQVRHLKNDLLLANLQFLRSKLKKSKAEN